MGLFDKLFKKEQAIQLPVINVADDAVVAVADGEMIDVTMVSDEVFAQKMMGESTAFKFTGDKVTLCAPANGTLSVLFPTGHAYGITRNDGVELLVHCGINTVEANGDGFKLLGKKQGDPVKAGDPIVEVDLKKLSSKYDMSTILIVTNPNGKAFSFLDPCMVQRGQSIIR
ncbi:MAG: PTS glucose transporter subunit IIA [Solobacterium sp.]|nr:PTS glucose transporter subunit IIA [Solobacterium sp.]